MISSENNESHCENILTDGNAHPGSPSPETDENRRGEGNQDGKNESESHNDSAFVRMFKSIKRMFESIKNFVCSNFDVIKFFTIILAISTCIQVWAFIQSERADLSVTSVMLDFDLLFEGNVSLHYTVQNGGKETAFVTGSATSIGLRTDTLPPEPQYTHPSVNALLGPVIPQSPRFVRIGPMTDDGPIIISKEQANSINNGSLKFYVFGYVNYKDTFSFLFGNRKTGFCFYYNPTLKDARFGNFDNCAEGAYTYSD
jgi:hypothetical protein